MAYRNDVEALEVRHQHLAAEVADRTRERDEVERMLVEARDRDAAERHFEDRAAGGPRKRRIRRLLIATAVLALIGALVGGALHLRESRRHAAARTNFAIAMTRMQLWTGELCQCTDQKCVQQITDEMTQWSQAHMKEFTAADPLTPDQLKVAQALGESMAKCISRAYAAEPQPDQEAR